jgi:hypothetical protein
MKRAAADSRAVLTETEDACRLNHKGGREDCDRYAATGKDDPLHGASSVRESKKGCREKPGPEYGPGATSDRPGNGDTKKGGKCIPQKTGTHDVWRKSNQNTSEGDGNTELRWVIERPEIATERERR